MVPRHRGVDCQGAPSWLSGSILPSPTYVAGPSGVPVVRSWVGTSAGTQGGGLQDVPEGSSGIFRPARSGLLQPPFSSGEGDRWLETSHQLVHPDQVTDGDSSIGFCCRFGKVIECFPTTSKTPTSRSPSIMTLGRISCLF